MRTAIHQKTQCYWVYASILRSWKFLSHYVRKHASCNWTHILFTKYSSFKFAFRTHSLLPFCHTSVLQPFTTLRPFTSVRCPCHYPCDPVCIETLYNQGKKTPGLSRILSPTSFILIAFRQYHKRFLSSDWYKSPFFLERT